MPTTSQYFSDLQLPTIFGDETTYGGILNTFIDGLATKIADLNTRLATATTQLGDNSTSGSLLFGINQLNTLNAQVAANSPALIPSNVLTGTETNIITSPDQFSGNRSTTSSFPAVPNASGTTANVLSALSPPTTEAEILAFDYTAFYNALAPVVADLSTRVSQVEADIASARVNICKAKKYTDAKQAGGTVARIVTSNSMGFLNYKKVHVSTTVRRYEALTTSSLSNTGGSFTGSVVPAVLEQYMPMTAGNSLTLAMYSQHGSNLIATYPNLGDTWQSCEVEVLESSMPASAGLLTATILRESENPLTFKLTLNYNPALASSAQAGFQSNTNNATNGFFTINNNENILVYTTPDVSTCDSSPGGPHYTSGSYS